MKVIYFERKQPSRLHIHAFSHARGFYIPNEEIVLFREQRGTFGGQEYSLNDDEKFLGEVKKAIANPELFSEESKEMHEGVPIMKDVTYSNIKEFEYDDSKVQQLIQEARLAKELEGKVQSGIESLLEQVK